jgi:putative spermidine/putrescine transport system permease protein
MSEGPDVHPLDRPIQRLHLLMVVPAILLLAVVFIYPVAALMLRSFYGESGFTVAQYKEIFHNDVYFVVIGLTFRIAALVTLICLSLGYPVSYLMTHVGPNTSRLLMITVVLPYFTSVIVRTYAWLILLGRAGVINQILAAVGVINKPVDMLYNQFGVTVGMSYVLLPVMVLTLSTVMRGIDQHLIRAAYSLGASKSLAFWRIFLPLSVPGIAGGSLLVFILAVGFFITPALMGGPRDITIAMLIEREVEITVNWPFASALATVLLIVTLSAFVAYSRFIRLAQFLERTDGR